MSYRNSTSAARVSNREIRRQAQKSIAEGAKVFATLLAVLAQKGGEVIVTQGTIDQVGTNLAHLGYLIVGGATPSEFIVRLVEGIGDASESPDTAAEASDIPTEAPPREAVTETAGGTQ